MERKNIQSTIQNPKLGEIAPELRDFAPSLAKLYFVQFHKELILGSISSVTRQICQSSNIDAPILR